jgi:anti-sigma regulatory factor (Ser/Thr protein kinase)
MELSLPGTDDAILRAARHVAELCGDLDFLEARKNEVQTAVVEALSNAAIHGNDRCEETPVRVRAEFDDQSLIVEVLDSGTGLTEVPPLPDLEKKLEGRDPPSGWGLYLMRSFASEVQFLVHPQEGHTVRLKFDSEAPSSLTSPEIGKRAAAERAG